MAGMRFLAFITFVTFGVNAIDGNRANLGRIVRGQDAAVGQFPYSVRMHVNYGENIRLCGAALIGNSWLLTAAHCFDDATAIAVYLGSVFMDDAKVAYKVPISNIALYPYYNRSLSYDIALLKIPPTALCENIGIVPLPKIEPSCRTYENYVARGSGWGAINDQKTLPGRLQWGRMKILRNEECKILDVSEHELCTAISSDWATICSGDSGGPLVLESTGELVGVVSACDAESCELGFPALFTRVTSYLRWIKSVSGIFYL